MNNPGDKNLLNSEGKHSHRRNNHNHLHSHQHSSEKNILTAFFLNLFFVLVEVAGGILTGSFAIISDAVHDFGDCAAIGCAYFLEKFSDKKADEKYTYGYRRYSLVSALITSGILLVGSVFVVVGAIFRMEQSREINGIGMLIIAVLGIVINGAAALRTSKGNGANEKAINLHMLEDVLGWIAVLVGSILISAFKWYFVDTLLSLCIAIFLIVHSLKNIAEVFGILLEKTPSDFSVDEYRAQLKEIESVENANHIHVWSLDGEKILATVCLGISGEISTQKYLRIKTAAEKLSENFSIDHLILQIDLENCPKEEN